MRASGDWPQLQAAQPASTSQSMISKQAPVRLCRLPAGMINDLCWTVVWITPHWQIDQTNALFDLTGNQRNVGFTDGAIVKHLAHLSLSDNSDSEHHDARCVAVKAMNNAYVGLDLL
jgi:hypothetical protein